MLTLTQFSLVKGTKTCFKKSIFA